MDWTVARAFFASFFAAFGTGAKDVVNSYATIAAGILGIWHVAILSRITESVGALALGARMTDTIKNDIRG